MSYSQFDDAHDHGFLTDFRRQLSREIQAQWGREFRIFQDIRHIAWGEEWRTKLADALGSATFLIPIITPSFFQSEACREEVAQFAEHEQQLALGNLILPLYYISTVEFEDSRRHRADPVASTLNSRQRADWRKLRGKRIDHVEVEQEIRSLATKITSIVWLSQSKEIEAEQSQHAPNDQIELASIPESAAIRAVVRPSRKRYETSADHDHEAGSGRIKLFGETADGAPCELLVFWRVQEHAQQALAENEQ